MGRHQAIREWVDPLPDVPTDLEEDLQQEVFARVAAADAIHYLPELGDEAIHDWGRVHDYFHEFTLFDRPAGRITLVVAADDRRSTSFLPSQVARYNPVGHSTAGFSGFRPGAGVGRAACSGVVGVWRGVARVRVGWVWRWRDVGRVRKRGGLRS